MLQYIYLAVAIAVLVGIVSVGVVMIGRRRSKVGLEGLTYADPTDPPEDRMDMEATEPEPAPAAAQPAPPHVDPAYAAPHAAALLADPLDVVILNMAEGKGRLTGQELKRLEVFRPERIELAVDTVDLPPRLAADDEVLLRLAQIKLYASTLELRAKWATQMGRTADDRLPDASLSARDFKLKMARDIMTLPKQDRSEVIGFLLGGLLNSSGTSPELKRAVIDTLEHLHSAALVNVLLDCIDDPDPIVQEYALAAADRLLD